MKGLSNAALWIVAGVVVLSLAGIIATIWLSHAYGVTEGYIPPEEREPPAEATTP